MRPFAQMQRFDLLDGMRGIAALTVMIYHYTLHTDHPLFKAAPVAVDIFFILSGFVLAHAYGDRILSGMRFSEFISKRLVRLYPVFALGLLSGGIILYFYSAAGYATYSGRDIASSLLANLAFLPYVNNGDIFPGNGIIHAPVFPGNDPLWSLCFEMIACVVFFKMVRLSRHTLIVLLAFCFVFLIFQGILSSILTHRPSVTVGMGWGADNFLGGFPRVFYGFILGMLLYDYVQNLPVKSHPGSIRRISGKPLLIYAALLLMLAFPYSIKGIYYFTALTLCAPVLMLLAAVSTCSNPSAKRFLNWLGAISYPVYCLHFPIGREVQMLGEKHRIGIFPCVLAASLITVLLSALALKFYEQPVLRMFKKPSAPAAGFRQALWR